MVEAFPGTALGLFPTSSSALGFSCSCSLAWLGFASRWHGVLVLFNCLVRAAAWVWGTLAVRRLGPTELWARGQKHCRLLQVSVWEHLQPITTRAPVSLSLLEAQPSCGSAGSPGLGGLGPAWTYM